eukprot:COSAG01_NODE_1156_length_11478_cov_3.862642_9_plen_103_part_00
MFFNGPRAGINANDGFGGGDEIGHNLVFSSCRESGDHGPFKCATAIDGALWVRVCVVMVLMCGSVRARVCVCVRVCVRALFWMAQLVGELTFEWLQHAARPP